MSKFISANLKLYADDTTDSGTYGTEYFAGSEKNILTKPALQERFEWEKPTELTTQSLRNHVIGHIQILMVLSKKDEHQKFPPLMDDFCARIINRQGGWRVFCQTEETASIAFLADCLSIADKLMDCKIGGFYQYDSLPVLIGAKTWRRAQRLSVIEKSLGPIEASVPEVPNTNDDRSWLRWFYE